MGQSESRYKDCIQQSKICKWSSLVLKKKWPVWILAEIGRSEFGDPLYLSRRTVISNCKHLIWDFYFFCSTTFLYFLWTHLVVSSVVALESGNDEIRKASQERCGTGWSNSRRAIRRSPIARFRFVNVVRDHEDVSCVKVVGNSWMIVLGRVNQIKQTAVYFVVVVHWKNKQKNYPSQFWSANKPVVQGLCRLSIPNFFWSKTQLFFR